MTKYINVDVLKNRLKMLSNKEGNLDKLFYNQILNTIEEINESNVRPVINAHWIYEKEKNSQGLWECECSYCGCGDAHDDDVKGEVTYCWNCGAKMNNNY